MDKKGSILALWGQLKSALSGEEVRSHEDHVPRNRMKQLENRGSGLTEAVSPLRLRGMAAMLSRIKRQVREHRAAN